MTPVRGFSALLVAAIMLAWSTATVADGLPPRLVVQGPAPLPKARYAWSPDGTLLVSISPATHAAQLWDGASGDLIDNIALPLADSPADRDYAPGDLAFDRGGTTVTVKLSLGLIGGCTMFRIDVARLAATVLPRPRDYCFSHADGRLPVSSRGAAIVETDDGTMLQYPGRAPIKLGNATPRILTQVVLSPDATEVALLRPGRPPSWLGNAPLAGETYLEIWNLRSGTLARSLHLTSTYAEVHWLTGDRVALIADTGPASASEAAIAPTLVIDVATGRVKTRLAGRCLVVPYGDRGDFLGGKPLDCANLDGKMQPVPSGLWAGGPNGRWHIHPDVRLQQLDIERIVAAPDGHTAIIVTRDRRASKYELASAGVGRAILVTGDLRAAAPVRLTDVPLRLGADEWINSVQYSVDGATAYVVAGERALAVDATSGRVVPLKLAPPLKDDFATGWDTTKTIASGIGELAMGAGDRRPFALSEVPGFLGAGFAPGGKLAWTTASDGTVRLYRRADWSIALTLQYLGAAGYVAYTSLGTYDTPLGPDSNAFRWRVPDEPLRSLGGQTFMRDYFEPGLFAKTLACTADGLCATALPPPPPVAGLNRTLPKVRIAAIRAGVSGDLAVVDVAAASVDNATAANGKTRSGMYNLRLFRGGKLVAQWPTAPAEATALDSDGWRRANRLLPGTDGVFRHSFTVRLPTGLRARHALFQAYAFNADRVKSATASATYDRPLVWPVAPKAYVLTIGIDDYAQNFLDLGFAVADADLLAARLGSMPGYRVRHLDLRGKGTKRQGTLAAIADAIALLAPGDHAAARARLRALGVDPSGFAAATPDDLVLITYAGHGWADPRGNFYLVPSDENWPAGDHPPDLDRLIPASMLSEWLRAVDAGNAAIIIDACNSAAVVATHGFKPGPLGDRGLGQLAYDKGILILAASQTNQSADEDARLGHGFLTAALARDGLDDHGFGLADLNDDGVITLDEWLRYAVARLPAINAEAAGAARRRDFRYVAEAADRDDPPPAPQQPSLFDFSGRPSPIVLRQEPAGPRIKRFAVAIGDSIRSLVVGTRQQQLWATDTIAGRVAMLLVISALVLILFLYGLFRLVRYVVRRLRK